MVAKTLVALLPAAGVSLLLSCKLFNPFNFISDVEIPTESGYTHQQFARLAAVMDKIDLKLDSLAETVTAPITSPQTVEAVLKTVPGVRIANEGDTSGSAIFVQVDENGPGYAIMWRSQQLPSDTTTPILDSTALADTNLGMAKGAGPRLPHGKDVYLFSALNGRGFPNWVPRLTPVFNRVPASYNVRYLDASTANLRTVSNASVLVFYGHGLPISQGTNYLLSTSTLESAMSSADSADYHALRLMAANFKMATATAWHAVTTKEDGAYARVLCITPRFIQKYWTFADNSLAIFDACWSGSFGAIGLKQAMYALNVSTTVGWSGKGDPSTVEKATCVLIDRMLGANAVAPVQKPSQRPFGRDDILPVLQKLGCDKSRGSWELSYSHIVFDPSGSSAACGILSPSIKRLEVDEMRRELKIHGLFGDDQTKGSVTIAGNERTISSWSETEIKCELKDQDCGLVRVVYADHKSNPVNLTMWKMKFTYTQQGPQGLQVKLDIESPWRADLHSFREKPDEEVTREAMDLLPTHAAHITYEASGVATDEETGTTLTYAGGGTTGSVWDATGPTVNKGLFWARFETGDTTRMRVYQMVMLSSGITQTATNKDGSDTRTLPVPLWKDMYDHNDVYVDYANPVGLKVGTMRLKKDVEFDENFGIKAGSVGPFTINSSAGAIVYKLSWEACPATAGPVPEWAH